MLNTMKEDSLEEELISVNWLRMVPSHISVQLPLCGQTLREDFCLSLPCTSELGQFLAQMVSLLDQGCQILGKILEILEFYVDP